MPKASYLKQAMAVNSLTWADVKGVRLAGGTCFSLKGRPYLIGLGDVQGKRISHIKKGSQIGATTKKFLDATHGCMYCHYEQNIIYMMPTVKQVEKMSKVAFSPIIQGNLFIKRLVTNDSVSIKTINGRSIVFVGARMESMGAGNAKDSLDLKSVSGDVIYRDEVDAMESEAVEMSRQRLLNSRHRIECNFGTPMIPGFGIDEYYDRGDQRKWQIKCGFCGKSTCLVISFPKSVALSEGRWRRTCIHCGREIFVNDGEWVPDFPSEREASFWTSGLLNPNADLEDIMYRYNRIDTDSKMVEFERSVLGRASIESDCQLSVAEVLNCCGNTGIRLSSSQTTAQGVDVNEKLKVVTGIRTGKRSYVILHVGEFDDFYQLHEFNEQMKVRMGVIDKGPDIHSVKRFQSEESYPIYRCLYSEYQHQGPDFNRETKVVKVNRNEISDMTHAVFTGQMVVIPRESPAIRIFADELTRMAKITENHPDTGLPKTSWKGKLGGKPDDFYHAMNYFLLAANITSPQRVDGKRKRLVLRNSHYL